MARPTTYDACTVTGCLRPHSAKGFCFPHYYRNRKYGDPTWEPPSKCTFEGCQKPPRGRSGLCKQHYHKLRRANKLVVRRRLCSEPGCQEPHASRGFCEDHYYRWKRYGDPQAEVSCRKGTGSTNRGGYRVITVDGKPKLEHRHVMEQSLGRKLTRQESVHHKNGVRDDNRLENLELWARYQPPGQRVEDKVAYAREILRLYGHLWPET